MYSAMYPSHFIQLTHPNHNNGRVYPSNSAIEWAWPRNGDIHFGPRKDCVYHSHSAVNLPHSTSKHNIGHSQNNGKVFYNSSKREYWNSKNQGKSKRLQHGNSAPCLSTAITEEPKGSSSDMSRSPTPNEQQQVFVANTLMDCNQHSKDKLNQSSDNNGITNLPKVPQFPKSNSHERITDAVPNRCPFECDNSFIYNHPPPNMRPSSGARPGQRPEAQPQQKRKPNFNRSQGGGGGPGGGFFRNRRPNLNNMPQYNYSQFPLSLEALIVETLRPYEYPLNFIEIPDEIFYSKNRELSSKFFVYPPVITAPDRFFLRSHLMQVTNVPENLVNGSCWDQLNESVWKKFYYHQQSEDTFKKKMALWKYLYVHIKNYFPKYGLYLVGSTMNGFGSQYSDVDLCLLIRYSEVDQRCEAVSYLSNIFNLLERCEFVEKLELIQAKVPLLKFRDSRQGIQVDLNCNNSVGIRNTHLLYCYSQMDWRVKPLVLVVKMWAQWHNINDAKNMTISSYSLALMVIHFLQCGTSPKVVPCLHNLYRDKFTADADVGSIDIHEMLQPYESENKQALGELLVEFYQYYATFDYLKYALSVRRASILPVEECRHTRAPKNDPHQWKYLCIEEPFDLTNTARSVYDLDKFEYIRLIFAKTSQILMRTRKLDNIFNDLDIS